MNLAKFALVKHPITHVLWQECLIAGAETRAAYAAAGMDPDGTPADHVTVLLEQMRKESELP